jgi:2-polyprenyl-6-methoxyphenol hydroxylase-like FAD-dependent oxidoreductase
VHLHRTLKEAATDSAGEGQPAQLHTSSQIVDVSPEKGTISLKDGSQITGDLIIGADGVHSIARAKVPGGDVKVFSSGKSAFRFLINRRAAYEDPITRPFVQTNGELIIWYGTDRRVVMYPTSDNELLNFVCIHPEAESDGTGDWNTQANESKILDVYKNFDPAMLALIKKADPESLKVWKLLDMPVLPTWISGRLALMGDAAHPFLSHQGQGGGCAIEDAAALSVVMEPGTKPEEIPERLRLYEKIRYERANRIQEYSRRAGLDKNDMAKSDSKSNDSLLHDCEFVPFQDPRFRTAAKMLPVYEYTNYNFGHDEYDNSCQALREWTWSRATSLYWRMPIAFGPMPGPRQTHLGIARQATESTFTTASIKFKTSRTVLQNLFPPSHSRGKGKYRFKNPGTVAYASFSQTTLNKMEWLGGSGYSHLGLYIHGVEYVKADGGVVSGTYMPLLFESLTDPIVSGREELGMPKLYTALDIYRREKAYRINASWQGAHWGSFNWTGLEEVDPKLESGKISGEDDDGILVYRYIPRVGRDEKGIAEAEYPVFVPYAEDMPQPQTKRVWKAKGKVDFKIDPLDWEALPTLHHIIQRLAEIPVYEIVGGKLVEGTGVPDVGAARRIE